ncbi:hypothetical protein CP061683_0326A, partial [Chlamydia psittaci 06-1683]
MAYNQVLQA